MKSIVEMKYCVINSNDILENNEKKNEEWWRNDNDNVGNEEMIMYNE
jgi:hypothetical protein